MSAGTRAMMAAIAASLSLSLVALLFSVDGPVGPIPVAMTWAAFGGGVAGTILWVWRWPTRVQSLIFALVTVVSITLACLAYPTPLAALTGCIAFSTIGAYIAFFHRPVLVVYNFMIAASVGVFQAVRLASSGHPALAGVDLFLVMLVNIALPLAISTLVRALGVDVLWADCDPLTGLFNRRAFQHKTRGLVVDRRAADVYLMVALLDLDDFKGVNDRHGHTVGDQVLVDVAETLRINTRDTAVIARSGGEEFLIADTSSSCDPTVLAQRICDAIAARPIMVTASVGTACILLDHLAEGPHQPLIDELVTAADEAMYSAKRSGGNRIHHHGLTRKPMYLTDHTTDGAA